MTEPQFEKFNEVLLKRD